MPFKQFAMTVFFQESGTTLVQLPSLACLEVDSERQSPLQPSRPPSVTPSQTLRSANFQEPGETDSDGQNPLQSSRSPPATPPPSRTLSKMPDRRRVNFEEAGPSSLVHRTRSIHHRKSPTPYSSPPKSDIRDEVDLDIYVPRRNPRGPEAPTQDISQGFAYAEDDYRTRSNNKRAVATHWYSFTTPGPLEHPPELPPNHRGLRHNDIFFHVDQQRRAELRSPRKTNAILQYITMWVWDGYEDCWELIEYGGERAIDGRSMCLSLYRGMAEPDWITLEGFKRRHSYHVRV